MSDDTFLAARALMDEFYDAWFVTPGGERTEGVALARRAADAVEQVWTCDLSPQEHALAETWLRLLLRVPEIEKEWFGLAEYREAHRVRS